MAAWIDRHDEPEPRRDDNRKERRLWAKSAQRFNESDAVREPDDQA